MKWIRGNGEFISLEGVTRLYWYDEVTFNNNEGVLDRFSLVYRRGKGKNRHLFCPKVLMNYNISDMSEDDIFLLNETLSDDLEAWLGRGDDLIYNVLQVFFKHTMVIIRDNKEKEKEERERKEKEEIKDE